jgi:hypothetical protein
VRNTGQQTPKRRKLLGLDQRVLSVLQILQGRFGRFLSAAYLFLRMLAIRYLLRPRH